MPKTKKTPKRDTDRIRAQRSRIRAEAANAETVRELLCMHPGGIKALAEECEVHKNTLYLFAAGGHRLGFPGKLATLVARRFRGRPYGKAVTAARLREAWMREFGG